MSVKIDIITCPQWGARKPKQDLELVRASREIIFHHTAGHHPEVSNPRNESREESMRYARGIQAQHMSQGWSDTGQNFLVCKNGLILQGRWLTVSAIQAHHMVRSAHCPFHNDQIGIEHEHFGDESMPPAQRESSSLLMAWIADKYDRHTVLPVFPHSQYYATACPANLKSDIPRIVHRAQEILNSD